MNSEREQELEGANVPLISARVLLKVVKSSNGS